MLIAGRVDLGVEVFVVDGQVGRENDLHRHNRDEVLANGFIVASMIVMVDDLCAVCLELKKCE